MDKSLEGNTGRQINTKNDAGLIRSAKFVGNDTNVILSTIAHDEYGVAAVTTVVIPRGQWAELVKALGK